MGDINVKNLVKLQITPNITPRAKALMTFLQDRNFFCEQTGQYTHCKVKTVEHLSTKCGSMLQYDHMWRHNEVV